MFQHLEHVFLLTVEENQFSITEREPTLRNISRYNRFSVMKNVFLQLNIVQVIVGAFHGRADQNGVNQFCVTISILTQKSNKNTRLSCLKTTQIHGSREK